VQHVSVAAADHQKLKIRVIRRLDDSRYDVSVEEDGRDIMYAALLKKTASIVAPNVQRIPGEKFLTYDYEEWRGITVPAVAVKLDAGFLCIQFQDPGYIEDVLETAKMEEITGEIEVGDVVFATGTHRNYRRAEVLEVDGNVVLVEFPDYGDRQFVARNQVNSYYRGIRVN